MKTILAIRYASIWGIALLAWLAVPVAVIAQGGQGILKTINNEVKTVTDPQSTVEPDNHPEVPYLDSLLKDPKLFRLSARWINYFHFTPVVLKSGLIPKKTDAGWVLLTPENREAHFFQDQEPGNVWDPFYVDATGNIFHDGRRYLYPDYKIAEPFPMINIRDSIDLYDKQCNEWHGNALLCFCSQSRASVLQAKAGLKKCNHDNPWARCEFVGVSNGYFVVDGHGLDLESDFTMEEERFASFDRARKVEYSSGGGRLSLPYFVWMRYLVTPKGTRFKYKEGLHEVIYNIQGKQYIITEKGMYEML